ncbi:MAG: protoglobin domain-containing protein [Phycisphaerales bacterium]
MSTAAITEILAKFDLREADFARIRAAAPVLKKDLDGFIEDFYRWMSAHREYQVFFGSNPARLERVKQMQRANWVGFLESNVDEAWIDVRRHVGAVHAHIDLPNDIYFAGMSISANLMAQRLRAANPAVKDLDQTIDSINKLLFLDTFVVIEEIARINREKISASSKALMEMSTPVTPIWEGILLLPLLGILDSQRTQDVMNKTLAKIAETRSKVFVMDISGVSAMDTAVANQLLKITKATQLMGCETILSGLSPAIARTLVELGVNIGEVRTTATLRDSFELALRAVGVDRNRLTSGS